MFFAVAKMAEVLIIKIAFVILWISYIIKD